jgi:hypothetical protein
MNLLEELHDWRARLKRRRIQKVIEIISSSEMWSLMRYYYGTD